LGRAPLILTAKRVAFLDPEAARGGDASRIAGLSQGAHISADTMLDRRLHMVNGQLRTAGVVDRALLAAFLEVARQRFVAPECASLAYVDRELPARGAKVRKLLPPMTLARMLQAATVVPGDRALDVAGGSGYGAATSSLSKAHSGSPRTIFSPCLPIRDDWSASTPPRRRRKLSFTRRLVGRSAGGCCSRPRRTSWTAFGRG
jgi:hypothetical protein